MGVAKMCSQLQKRKAKAMAINIAAKVFHMLYTNEKAERFIFTSRHIVHMGGEAYKRTVLRLVVLQ